MDDPKVTAWLDRWWSEAENVVGGGDRIELLSHSFLVLFIGNFDQFLIPSLSKLPTLFMVGPYKATAWLDSWWSEAENVVGGGDRITLAQSQ